MAEQALDSSDLQMALRLQEEEFSYVTSVDSTTSLSEVVFTRWVNKHLKTVNKFITSLKTGFSDGLCLIELVQILSGCKILIYNKKPVLQVQKLENISTAINALKYNNVKIVNIDSSDIVDGNMTLILGLVWALILHYTTWDDSKDHLHLSSGKPLTHKQKLLNWVQRKLPLVFFKNFLSEWLDGKLLAALIDSLVPGLCPQWTNMKKENALQNVTKAMDIAKNHMNIPELLKPLEWVKLDDRDGEALVMLYLSQFVTHQLNMNRRLSSSSLNINPLPNPKNVQCYGSGINPTGVTVGSKTTFTIQAVSSDPCAVRVIIENPNGGLDLAETKSNFYRDKTYTVSYTAVMEGMHKVTVIYGEKEVHMSPFLVMVAGKCIDPLKVKVSGPGLASYIFMGIPTFICISIKDAGSGEIEVLVLDTQNTIPCELTKDDDDTYKCKYIPQSVGAHTIFIFFAGQQIPNSPFNVEVIEDLNVPNNNLESAPSEDNNLNLAFSEDINLEPTLSEDNNLDLAFSEDNNLEPSASEVELIDLTEDVEEVATYENRREPEEKETSLMCIICFEALTYSGDHRVVSLKCGHLFGLICISQWLEQGDLKCPQCKSEVNESDVRPIYATSIEEENIFKRSFQSFFSLKLFSIIFLPANFLILSSYLFYD